MDTPATVYVTTTQTTLEWLAQAYQAEISIINCEYNNPFTGFLLTNQRLLL